MDELKAITRCAHCKRIGHWHRVSRTPQGQGQRATPPGLHPGGEGLPAGYQMLPALPGDGPCGEYECGEPERLVLSRISTVLRMAFSPMRTSLAFCQVLARIVTATGVSLVLHTNLKNMSMKSFGKQHISHDRSLSSRSTARPRTWRDPCPEIDERCCATVDTGCQRIAVGRETLDALQRSSTSQRWCLRQSDTRSRAGPFLISLPFMMFCR